MVWGRSYTNGGRIVVVVMIFYKNEGCTDSVDEVVAKHQISLHLCFSLIIILFFVYIMVFLLRD